MDKIFILGIIAVFWLLIDGAGDVHAMTAFARKYNLKCDACHKAKIPELNEFGIGFYQNGFSFAPNPDIKNDKPKNDSVTPKLGGKMFTAEDQVDRKDTSSSSGVLKNGDQGASGGEKELGEVENVPKEPLPPTVVYRSQGRDGSLHYTDNPYHRDFLKAESGEKHAQPQKRVVFTKTKQREPALKSVKQQHHVSTVVPAQAERFRSYEECMERQLVAAPQPASAQETMSIFMETEQKCSPFPMERR